MGDSSNLFRRALFRRVTAPVEGPSLSPTAKSAEDAYRGRLEARLRSLARAEDTLPAVAAPRGRRALVVEDDHVIRAAIASVLDDLGWRVVETPTLDGARLVLEGLRPDVLVLDFNLSGEYASVLLDELRHRRRLGPTVIVSASPLAIDTARAHGIELLQKPFGIDALVATVERVSSRPPPPHG
jgi:CheY-like chemotaxis protein